MKNTLETLTYYDERGQNTWSLWNITIWTAYYTFFTIKCILSFVLELMGSGVLG